MKKLNELKATASFVLDAALKAGADKAAVKITNGRSTSVSIRRENAEVADRTPESIGGAPDSMEAAVSVYIGKQNFSARTTKLHPEALRALVQRCVEVARVLPADEYAGLPEPQHQATSLVELPLFTPDVLMVNMNTMKAHAADAEAAAFATSPLIRQSSGAGYSTWKKSVVYGNTNGFLGGITRAGCGMHAVVVAEKDGNKNRGYRQAGATRRSKLPTPAEVGRLAAERAIRGLGARQVNSQKVPVVFEPQVAESLLENIADALAGEAVFLGQTHLGKQLGKKVACSNLQITDDPFIPYGPASTTFGPEGIAVCKRNIIRDGVLESLFIGAGDARKLKTVPNGGGPTNLFIEGGNTSPEAIIGSVKNGLYLTGLMGHGFNQVTGGFSFGAEGVWIVDGQLAFPVAEITVASKLQDMLPAIEAIGNDLDLSVAAAPTLLIGSMMVGGN